ncbi:MAG TPA: hypothetical protein PKI49_11165 [Pseudomonadota bacterium]|jgi:3-hydroxymyristoyl/3-hydroxydecanoyl-(acyl carrier protein) dehydratase|nr:hypothetical protein [Pseudomonadota bacterium]HNF96906.1 hypothetical protein [Pseudomonadota bacterium]HNK46122.1 hypothetical protein [Pseudomonadota bacterium]HNN49946.1 hypothetical protein [Pseudomonadota bacterium]HNO69060.1 hypothetical protein [Pseudomonadota bacterium]
MRTVPSLPQTPPFRLIDRIVEYDAVVGSLVAEKQLTEGDALWPAGLALSASVDRSYPQTLLVEALCQAAAAFNMLSAGESSESASAPAAEHRGYLVGVSDLRFPNFVRIGETLRLSVKKQQTMGSLVSFLAEATAIALVQADTSALAPRQVVHGRLLFSVMAA